MFVAAVVVEVVVAAVVDSPKFMTVTSDPRMSGMSVPEPRPTTQKRRPTFHSDAKRRTAFHVDAKTPKRSNSKILTSSMEDFGLTGGEGSYQPPW